jgi:hypothetical protein
MAVIYDDLIVVYDYGLTTYDGDTGAGSISGEFTETSTMTGTITS